MKLKAAVVLSAALAASCLVGCSSESQDVTRPQLPLPAPEPASPAAAVRLFDWGWDQRDLGAFQNLLSEDFRFVSAPGDSSGNVFGDDPFDRVGVLLSLRNLFIGAGSCPRATSIVLALDPTLTVTDDSRPGRSPRWHKEVRTSVDLDIRTEDAQEFRVTGSARFFLVRGDSAIVPPGGAGADSTRWYLQEWDDETFGGVGGALQRALPATSQRGMNPSVRMILVLYYECAEPAGP